MYLFRTAVVLGIAVALMPSDPEKQQALISTAREKTVWVMTYCDREPDTCTQAQGAWSAFLAKAEFAGRLVGEVATYQAGMDSEPTVRKVTTAKVVNGRVQYSEDMPIETSALADQ
ncbi:MAG: hypothetical protein U1E49_00045 [Hyphomicrobiaceae bacterium]